MQRTVLFLSAVLGAAACAGARPVADAPTENHAALPFPWWPGEVRPIVVTPLRYDGTPTPCGTETGGDRPCDIEVTEAGEVYYRSHSGAPAGVIGPGLELRRKGEPAVFVLDPDGTLIGGGLFQSPATTQVLFCSMNAVPALQCYHDFNAAAGTPIWAEEQCHHTFELRVLGGEIVIELAQEPGATSVVARVEPAPEDEGAEALALFLYAMELVEGDTTYHTPYDDPYARL